VLERLLGHPEQRVQVRLHHAVEVVGAHVGERLAAGHLVARVVHQQVQTPEALDGRAHRGAGGVLVPQVGRYRHAGATGLADPTRRLVGVLLLLGQVADRHVGALACERDRHRAPDARVAAGDVRAPLGQQPVPDVRRLAVVGLRPHGGGQAGRFLALAGLDGVGHVSSSG
jgi:hypothetical protein